MSGSTGQAAEAARAAFRAAIAEKGHSTEVARQAVAGLEAALADGTLRRTPSIEAILADLAPVLGGGAEKVGGKSGEAARLILRALSRALDEA